MRNRCLPNPRIKYFWKRKINKEERTAAKAKEVSNLTTGKKMIREVDAEGKSHVHDSRTSIKNRSLRVKEVTNGKPRDTLDYKSIGHDSSAANKNSSLYEKEVIVEETKVITDANRDDLLCPDESLRVVDVEKDEKLTVEQGLESVNVNHTPAKQDSTQDQKKTKRGLPKFGEWDVNEPASADGFTHMFEKVREERRGALNDEFHKVKTFDLRGVKSGEKGLKAIPWSRLFSVK